MSNNANDKNNQNHNQSFEQHSKFGIHQEHSNKTLWFWRLPGGKIDQDRKYGDAKFMGMTNVTNCPKYLRCDRLFSTSKHEIK